jgi:hypothetical protein
MFKLRLIIVIIYRSIVFVCGIEQEKGEEE